LSTREGKKKRKKKDDEGLPKEGEEEVQKGEGNGCTALRGSENPEGLP